MIIQNDKKKVLSQILGPSESEKKEEGGDNVLLSICDELLAAIEAKDSGGVASCLKAAFAHCEAEPHEEYGG